MAALNISLFDSAPLFRLFWNVNGIVPADFKIFFRDDGIRVIEPVAGRADAWLDLLIRAEGFDSYAIAEPFAVSTKWADICSIFPRDIAWTWNTTITFDPATQVLSFRFTEPNGDNTRESVFDITTPLLSGTDAVPPTLPAVSSYDAVMTLPSRDFCAYMKGMCWIGPTITFETTEDTDTNKAMFVASVVSDADGPSCKQYCRDRPDYSITGAPSNVTADSSLVQLLSPNPAPGGECSVRWSGATKEIEYNVTIAKRQPDPEAPAPLTHFATVLMRF